MGWWLPWAAKRWRRNYGDSARLMRESERVFNFSESHTSFSAANLMSTSSFRSTGVSLVEYMMFITACFSPMTRWWSPWSEV